MKSKTIVKEIMPLLLQYCNNYNMAAESNKKYYYGMLCGICDAEKSVAAETAAFCIEHIKAAADYKNQYEFINPRRWYYDARQDNTK